MRWLVGLAAAVWAVSAQAHIVYGAKTLHGLVAESDLVVRARITAVDRLIGVSTEQGGSGRPGVEAEVLAVLKGKLDGRRVHFAQHGHGVVRFEAGRETLLFLIDIARSRELDALGNAGLYRWVSIQEDSDEYPLEPATRERVLAAAHSYVAAESAPSPELRQVALHRATRELLTSGDPQLAASALRDLVRAPSVPLITSEDLPALLPLLDDARTSMGVRVGLLAELERRRLVDGASYWSRLLSSDAAPRDRVTAIRAAASSRSETVRARLVALVSDPNEEVAAAAALAIGRPGDTSAVAPLASALQRPSARLRMAAIRGLGRIAAPDAMRVLESAAASHPDPETRRRAAAELRKRGAPSSAG